MKIREKDSKCIADNDTYEKDSFFSDNEDDLILDYDDDFEDESLVKTKGKWNDVKDELNKWGNIFSTGTPDQRIVAIERILTLFEQVTYKFSSSENQTLYNNADNAMRRHFIGESDHPIRFLKHIYPEDMFYDAILYTLGFSTSKRENGITQNPHAYDASKGAKYVTYFTDILKFFCKRRRRDLNDQYKKFKPTYIDDITENDIASQESSAEAQAIEENCNQQAALLVDLATLTADKLQLDKMLSIDDNAANKPKNLKAATLQLFYSFQLVNFSRFATSPVSRRDDLILIGAADKNFLTFSTTIQTLTYEALIPAELSAYVLQNNLYRIEDTKKILIQRAAAHYRGVSESTLSPQFEAAQRYLKKHWKYI